MDAPVNVPVDDPNADTEWNDILRKHGIIPEKPPSPTPMIEEAIVEARRLAHENRLEGKNLDELDELEDEEDEEFLDKYRKQRMEEMAKLQKTSLYNQVYPLQKPDYSRDVTEASYKSFIFVLLTSSQGNSNTESALCVELWRSLAAQYGDIKFCQIRADLCIEGYPERNTPTVLIYKDGDIKKQLVTLKELRGSRTTFEDFEKLLVEVGAIQRNDIRVQRNDDHEHEEEKRGSTIHQGKNTTATVDEDEDSDWD